MTFFRNTALAIALLSVPALAAIPPVIGTNLHYKVKKGDNLYKIARHFNLALEHIAFANDLKVDLKAPVGRTLLIPERRILPYSHPATGIVVNIPERMVYVFEKNRFVAFYPCAIGKGAKKTPLGHFKIIERVKNPTWTPPAWAHVKAPIKAGPDDPLGDRWIGLSAPGIGLHSTTDPMSVGDDASHGCMRMYPKLAHKLFKEVRVGWPAWIVYEPVKFGLDSKKNQIDVQVFPDVYHHRDSLHSADREIASEGLQKRISLPVVHKLLGRPSGVVMSAK
jgi:L,D-transpeptidase ErfK/SrfK